MSSTTKSYFNCEYIQPSLTHSYDSSQSPLALLAQTCSSIGKDSSPSDSTPPIRKSLVRKSSSSIISNSDKWLSSRKKSSLSQLNNRNTNKNSTLSLKRQTLSTSSSFIEPNLLSNTFPPLIDPRTILTELFLRSSLSYLSSQQQHSYSTICPIPGCLQCQTLKYILSSSINPPPYKCHWKNCNGRFSSNDQLIEHIRYTHRSSKSINFPRFHPYFKPSPMINSNNHLPFSYPHLSFSSMTETTRRLNNHHNNK